MTQFFTLNKIDRFCHTNIAFHIYLGCGILEVLLTSNSAAPTPVNIWSCGCIYTYFLARSHSFVSCRRILNPPTFLSKTHKPYFCLSLLLILNSFFDSIISYVPEIACRPPTSIYNAFVFFIRNLWSWHGDPWADAGLVHDGRLILCTTDIFAKHAHPVSLLLLNLSCFTDYLDNFCDRFRPLWHTCSHSPRNYAKVPNNWLIPVAYLTVIYLL